MKNTVVTAAVAAVVGVAAAIGAAMAGLTTAGGGFQKKTVHATIFLDQRGPNCIITTVPQTVEMWRNETIEWTIIDGCGVLNPVAAMVEVRFPVAADPLDACERQHKKKIRCMAKNGAAQRFYKYEVLAPGAETEDPEIEIAQ